MPRQWAVASDLQISSPTWEAAKDQPGPRFDPVVLNKYVPSAVIPGSKSNTAYAERLLPDGLKNTRMSSIMLGLVAVILNVIPVGNALSAFVDITVMLFPSAQIVEAAENSAITAKIDTVRGK